MVEKLFVYGTLQQPEVQNKIIGRIASSQPDHLAGFERSTIDINGNSYLIIIENPDSQKEIEGLVLDIRIEEFEKLDEYETKAYQRKEVVLKSGIKAWTYQK